MKIIGIILLIVLAVAILVPTAYVIYLSIQYYRIEDNQNIEIINNDNLPFVELNHDYTIATYNIGFGAYSHDFSFFMDKGEMLDGTKTKGVGSRAKNKDTVLTNTNGAISTMRELNADFMLFQEVDVKAQRSFKVNQFDMINKEFAAYNSNIALNFHSGYLLYPFNNPHGAVEAGVATYSKYKIEKTTRRSLPIDNGFFAKFFDLDRCFSLNRLKVMNAGVDTGKQLVIINLHLSAFDEGGKIRAKQLNMLNQVLTEEYEKGNYVIAGGDFNHDVANSMDLYNTQQKLPEWLCDMNSDQLADNYEFASATNAPTCRSTDIAYTKGVNYSVVLDGFIKSSNLTVVNVTNIDNDFIYSDHNPVKCVFRLT